MKTNGARVITNIGSRAFDHIVALLFVPVFVVVACGSRGDDESKRLAEQARREEQAREANRAKAEAERARRCALIAVGIQRQQLSAEDESWLGSEGQLTRRMLNHTMVVEDSIYR